MGRAAKQRFAALLDTASAVLSGHFVNHPLYQMDQCLVVLKAVTLIVHCWKTTTMLLGALNV